MFSFSFHYDGEFHPKESGRKRQKETLRLFFCGETFLSEVAAAESFLLNAKFFAKSFPKEPTTKGISIRQAMRAINLKISIMMMLLCGA